FPRRHFRISGKAGTEIFGLARTTYLPLVRRSKNTERSEGIFRVGDGVRTRSPTRNLLTQISTSPQGGGKWYQLNRIIRFPLFQKCRSAFAEVFALRAQNLIAVFHCDGSFQALRVDGVVERFLGQAPSKRGCMEHVLHEG